MRLSAAIRPALLTLLFSSASLLLPVRAEDRLSYIPAKQMELAGVDNFGRVDQHLYRGAQPQLSAFPALKRMGVDTVVKLDSESEPGERQMVESLGMRFVDLPWSASGEPKHEQVVTFLALLHDHPDYHIFVHCRVGADRTGVMVALYRITFDHWAAAQAIEEMSVFHYHHLFLPHLARYVAAFPSVLASDPDLRNLAPPLILAGQ